MLRPRLGLFALAASSAAVVQAQQSGWQPRQVSATMCYWSQLRAAVVRDTVYLDGGHLYWIPGLDTGEFGAVTQDGNPLGLVYTLNFSTPFNFSQNISQVLSTISKAPNGGNANNIAPNYFDGAMLANNEEWFLYGGLLAKTDAYELPEKDDVTGYQAYQYGVQKDGFRPGFVIDRLPDSVTRYVTYGGAANVPSENKAFYFGGFRSPTWGEIYLPSINTSINAVNTSDTLIILDMAVQQQETWTNVTLPSFIKSRANPEFVFVPRGPQGILVALGGVVYPEFVSPSHRSANETQSAIESKEFITTIDIYDIATRLWYQQPTVGGPSQPLARGCAVVAPSRDYSSFNIYYYGGYDGVHIRDSFNDDVWVLSLPSFVWTRVSTGNPDHARAGHKCVMPYPDQMMVIGGYANLPGAGSPACLQGGIIQMFNLTSAKWVDSYDPEVYGEYGVPESVYAVIGGNAAGGATMTAPTPTGWANPALASVWSTPYPTSKLKTFYPYSRVAPPNDTRQALPPPRDDSVPAYVAPVTGVIAGLFVLTLAVLGFFFWRKRRILRLGGTKSESGVTTTTDDTGNRILSWIRGQSGTDTKAPPTVTTEDSPMSPSDLESNRNGPSVHRTPSGVNIHPPIAEMADSALVELPDTSRRVELQDTGLTPAEIIQKHTHFGTGNATNNLNNPSYYSSGMASSLADRASTVSRSSGAAAGHSNANHSQSSAVRSVSADASSPDSPSIGFGPAQVSAPGTPGTPGPSSRRIASGVSGLSDTDRSHLRQISEASAISSVDSSVAAGGGGLSAPIAGMGYTSGPILMDHPTVASPVTMPTPSGALGGSDYVSAGQAAAAARGAEAVGAGPSSPATPGQPGGARAEQPPTSPMRRSVFYENEEDMGGNSK